ncbi:amidase [Burkholderia gladioli]|uniref:amidase n=1 Tax=Burkholderia gladioli TaxID=28095 RepID=UPI00163DFE5E|nr:amidase [Burkholderia gladioli]
MLKGNGASSSDLLYQDAVTLASLIRTKQVSPVEIMQAHLDRVEAVNPKVNAITTLLADQAMQSAKAAERAVENGSELGAFHGVPFTIKDSIDLANVVTQAGSRLLSRNVPHGDATTVARMKRAGAIPLAKTNVPEFSYWTETDNRVTGRTNNPWNLDRTPGGSSGGESAAIAAGMSPMGLGSDVAISVRGPAALTGIVGLKATHGRVPYTGHMPRFLSRYWHIGPMARSVRDVAAMFDVIKGADGADPYAIHARDARSSKKPRSGAPVRIGYLSKKGFGPIDPEVAATVEAVGKLLEQHGHHIEQASIPLLEQNDFVGVGTTLTSAEMLPDFRRMVAGREADLFFVGARIASMFDPSLKDYIAAQELVQDLKSAFARYFEQYDLLLCPVIPFTAPPHQQREYIVDGKTIAATQIKRATVPFNLTGLPALSVPFRMSSENLPINVQLVARWLDEETILNIGAAIESASTVWDQRPPL